MRQKLRLPLILPCLAVLLLGAQSPNWSEPFPPHRVVGNVYYVGSSEMASYLITTPAGHILINNGVDDTVPVIQAGCEKPGFKFSDIKLLLTCQAHLDHVGGFARIKKLTGAKTLVMAEDEAVVRGGGKGDFAYEGQMQWAPCPVDRVLHDREEVTLGSTTLVAHLTPGHTKGCTTWTLSAQDGGKAYRVVIVGGTGVNPGYQLVNNARYSKIAEDYARTFQVLESLPCDIFLGSHASYYRMKEKYTRSLQEGVPAFVDPEGYRRFVASGKAAYLKELEIQRSKVRP